MLESCQEKNEVMLRSDGFFERVCEALGVKNVYGVKSKIAEMAGVSPNAVGLWEKGEMPGRNSLENLAKISLQSNTSIHWLLTGQGEKTIHPKEELTINELVEIIYEATKDSLYALDKFVVELAKKDTNFRKMLNDISYKKSERIANAFDDLLRTMEEEDIIRHQNLIEHLNTINKRQEHYEKNNSLKADTNVSLNFDDEDKFESEIPDEKLDREIEKMKNDTKE